MFKTDKHSPSYIKTVKNDQMSNANQLTKKQLPFISVTKENSNKVRALHWIFYSPFVLPFVQHYSISFIAKKKSNNDKILRCNIALTAPRKIE